MATQFDPIAKDESLNTTESPSRNVADVLAQGLDAIEQAIAGGSGSGGHVIEDTNGTALTQRADLQFVGVYTEDDSANDRTKVNVVRTMTKAQMDALSAAEKVGFIRTSDEADNPYQGAESVSVKGDGVKTIKTLLNELFALVDTSKITIDSKLILQSTATSKTYLFLYAVTDTEILFSNSRTTSNLAIITVALRSTNSFYNSGVITTASAVSISDFSTAQSVTDTEITVFY